MEVVMPNTGEKPGMGTYECTNCGTLVKINDSDEALPICPACGNTEFEEAY